MDMLLIDTEHARAMAREINRVVQETRLEVQALARVEHTLRSSWHGPAAQSFLVGLDWMMTRFSRAAEDGQAIGTRLLREIDEWERTSARFIADGDSARSTTDGTLFRHGSGSPDGAQDAPSEPARGHGDAVGPAHV